MEEADKYDSASAQEGAICAAELLLLREMTHRISNELASMIGFVSHVAAGSTNCGVKLALAEVVERLHDHARIHRILQIPTTNHLVDATAYLRELCRAISRAKLERNGIELVLVEHSVRLPSVQCWRLGMIVSELVTNAYQHAFSESGGTIRIELMTRESYAECRVADDGRGSDIVQSGHGLTIVRSLARMLDGNIDLSFSEDGVVAMVSFPVLRQVEDGPVIESDFY